MSQSLKTLIPIRTKDFKIAFFFIILATLYFNHLLIWTYHVKSSARYASCKTTFFNVFSIVGLSNPFLSSIIDSTMDTMCGDIIQIEPNKYENFK